MDGNTTQDKPGLNINDLAAMLQIIGIATQRGAFKAEEMSSIGTVYDRVAGFVKAHGPATPADNQQNQKEEKND